MRASALRTARRELRRDRIGRWWRRGGLGRRWSGIGLGRRLGRRRGLHHGRGGRVLGGLLCRRLLGRPDLARRRGRGGPRWFAQLVERRAAARQRGRRRGDRGELLAGGQLGRGVQPLAERGRSCAGRLPRATRPGRGETRRRRRRQHERRRQQPTPPAAAPPGTRAAPPGSSGRCACAGAAPRGPPRSPRRRPAPTAAARSARTRRRAGCRTRRRRNARRPSVSSRFTFVYDHPVSAQISRYEKPSAFSTSARTSCGFSWRSASAPWRSRSSRSACSCVTADGAGLSRSSPSSVTGEWRSRWRRSANASCFTTVFSHGISSSSRVLGAFVSRISIPRW